MNKPMKKTIPPLTLLILLLCITPTISAQDDTTPPTIVMISPQEGEIITNQTPNFIVEYYDLSGIDTTTVRIIVNNLDVSDWEETTITATSVTYKVPQILRLQEGNHTVTVEVTDIYNNKATKTWMFVVDLTQTILEEQGIDLFTILTYIIYAAVISVIAFCLWILYLKKTRKFTFRKYFAQHPIQQEIISLYIPLLAGFFVILFGLVYTTRTIADAPFSPEYVVVVGLLIALGPYTAASLAEKRRIRRYEQAFAQFLFEMADAMRGGLDPTKAIIELAKTNKGILADHLRKASENIKLGRPFEEVMQAMVRTIKSDLVKRYATIIGDASKIGGETSLVIYRTAKDMDDFIKINQERRRQLTAQVTTIYIAFAVLLIILYQLIIMFPSMGSMNISLLGATSLESTETSSAVIRMTVETMKRRFLHLMMINSLGTGTLMGMLVDGKIKYGLIHSLILTVVSVVFFAILIL